MADEPFKYPPGIQPVEHWQQVEAAWGGIERSAIEAIQQDAVLAERRSNAATLVRWTNQQLDEQLIARFDEICTLEELVSNNAAHKDKICKCVFASWNRQRYYDIDGVRKCAYCDRSIL